MQNLTGLLGHAKLKPVCLLGLAKLMKFICFYFIYIICLFLKCHNIFRAIWSLKNTLIEIFKPNRKYRFYF
jgi:hypothetical protein